MIGRRDELNNLIVERIVHSKNTRETMVTFSLNVFQNSVYMFEILN